MLKQIPKLLLLLALLTGLVVSSAPAFGDGAGGCRYEANTGVCVALSCRTSCGWNVGSTHCYCVNLGKGGGGFPATPK
jgi:hypothetical protein